MNYPYSIFNQTIYSYPRNHYEKMQRQSYDNQQRQAIYDSTKAIDDFLDAMSKIAPQYHNLADITIFARILERYNKR